MQMDIPHIKNPRWFYMKQFSMHVLCMQSFPPWTNTINTQNPNKASTTLETEVVSSQFVLHTYVFII